MKGRGGERGAWGTANNYISAVEKCNVEGPPLASRPFPAGPPAGPAPGAPRQEPRAAPARPTALLPGAAVGLNTRGTGNVGRRDFSKVDPNASLLTLLARAFHVQELTLLLYFQADQVDRRMSLLVFSPAILLTINPTINDVIHVSCSLTYCICGIFFLQNTAVC